MTEQFESPSDPTQRGDESAAAVPEPDPSQPDPAASDVPAEAVEASAETAPDQQESVPESDAPQAESAQEPQAAEAESPAPAGAPSEDSPAEAEAAPEQPAPESPEQVAQTAEGPATEKPATEASQPEQEPEEPKSDKMDWYILKVQSNREDSIAAGLRRRIKIAGLDYYFGKVIVPTETVTEFKGGKKRVTKRKLYPGYLVVQMEVNDETWFLVRETPGIGDFTGAGGKPTPLLPHEVDRLLARQQDKTEQAPKLKIAFSIGDRVKINEGTFENFQGEVSAIDETNGRVTVMINIFGRSTPVELEYWQVESL